MNINIPKEEIKKLSLLEIFGIVLVGIIVDWLMVNLPDIIHTFFLN